MSETATESRIKIGAELVKLDTKFSKAISEVLCSIGELRQSVLENAAEYSELRNKLIEHGTYLDDHIVHIGGHTIKIQALEKAMAEVNQSNEKRLTLLESQVKKLFANKADKIPIDLTIPDKSYKIRVLVNKLQDAIKEYNRG